MQINKMLNNFTNIKKIDPCATTFKPLYNFFLQNLFERTMRLFEWQCEDIPQKELEAIALIGGMCCVTKYKGKLTAFNGWYSGAPTVYFDEWKDFAIFSPIYSKILKVDTDCILLHNNSTNSPLYPLISEYAVLLAHNELTIINVLINLRNTSGVPTVTNEAQKQSILAYRNSLCNGKINPVMDDAFMGINFKGNEMANRNVNIKDLIETRKNLFDMFYNDIGVKTSWNKKGNMIAEEVKSDEPMLLININDMLKCRKDFCKRVNAKYGVNFSVELCEELRYNDTLKNEESEDNNNGTMETLQN